MSAIAQLHPIHPVREMIGESAAIRNLRSLLLKVAQSHATTVLLSGESGTGKDLAAKMLHQQSERRARSFLTITCSALQESLLDSELFGHEKGSFTDAKMQKRGLLELADGGTVFLDEVGEMSPGLQAKLLRFLEDHSFMRVGGGQDVRVDVRVVAATHRDLHAAVQAGTFREDLYFRLRAVPVEIPPLRDRQGDVALLTDHFQRIFACEEHRPVRPLTQAARAYLDAHYWPGNVRELRNAVERAVLLGEGAALAPSDFDLSEGTHGALALAAGASRQVVRAASTAVSMARCCDKEHPDRPLYAVDHGPEHLLELPPHGLDIAALEQDLVVQAIQRTHGNQAMAAELLGMTRDQMRYRVAKLRESGAYDVEG
ncbi:MAG: sigma-54-dependent Fis family transcriptional regulator [Deltaproteobacteria bacterium]|nr:sigma-54-dependent Fis family transcriptional regulator [Deltaproteobacteria bacterium]